MMGDHELWCDLRVKPAGVVCDGYRVIFVSG